MSNAVTAATLTVYRTRGTVYHTTPKCGLDGRRSLSTAWAVELGSEYARGLKPCAKCAGEAA
jgi:hypothetical protein